MEFVGGGVVEVPAEGDAAERGVDEDGAVAVVPGEAEQSGLAGFEMSSRFGERGYGSAGAGGDGGEDISDGGHTGFDANLCGIDGAGDDAADAGDEGLLVAEADDAGGRADDIDDVTETNVSADGVPVGVEGSGGDGDTGGEAEFVCPLFREVAGDLVSPLGPVQLRPSN